MFRTHSQQRLKKKSRSGISIRALGGTIGILIFILLVYQNHRISTEVDIIQPNSQIPPPPPPQLTPQEPVSATLGRTGAAVEQEVCAKDLQELLTAQSLLHNSVQKQGSLPLEYWYPSKIGKLQYEFGQWLLRSSSMTQEQELQSNFMPPPSAPCTVLLNNKYRFIFLKNTKTAGTSAFVFLGNYCDPKGNKEPQPKDKPSCMKRVDYHDAPDEAAARQMWMTYFVFTISRNSYSRVGSSYDYMLGRRAPALRKEPNCQDPSFLDFCRSPTIVAKQDRLFGCLEDRIHDFYHVEPQARCLTTGEGQPAIDFVIRVENIDQDFQEAIRIINERRPEGLPELKGKLGKLQTTGQGDPHLEKGPKDTAKVQQQQQLQQQQLLQLQQQHVSQALTASKFRQAALSQQQHQQQAAQQRHLLSVDSAAASSSDGGVAENRQLPVQRIASPGGGGQGTLVVDLQQGSQRGMDHQQQVAGGQGQGQGWRWLLEMWEDGSEERMQFVSTDIFNDAAEVADSAPDAEQAGQVHEDLGSGVSNGQRKLQQQQQQQQQQEGQSKVKEDKHVPKFRTCGQPCIDAVVRYYQDDFKFFGYPTCVDQL